MTTLADLIDGSKEGARDWGRRPTTAGAIFHTDEYPGRDRATALQVIRDQSRRTATGGWVQPGSYNLHIHYTDGKAGMIESVPVRHASGGLAGPGTPNWEPDAWLREALHSEAFRDPTMHHIQFVFTGSTARLVAGLKEGKGWARAMVMMAARAILAIERSDWGADNLILSGHRNWQNNKSDPGAGTIDRILNRYDSLIEDATPDVSCEDVAARRLKRIARLERRLEDSEAIIDAVRETVAVEG